MSIQSGKALNSAPTRATTAPIRPGNEAAPLPLRGQVAREKKVGLVPTMGYLHEGHLSLVHQGRAENDILVVSIFVNPAQFGPHEDLGRYPRDLPRDLQLLEDFGCGCRLHSLTR